MADEQISMDGHYAREREALQSVRASMLVDPQAKNVVGDAPSLDKIPNETRLGRDGSVDTKIVGRRGEVVVVRETGGDAGLCLPLGGEGTTLGTDRVPESSQDGRRGYKRGCMCECAAGGGGRVRQWRWWLRTPNKDEGG